MASYQILRHQQDRREQSRLAVQAERLYARLDSKVRQVVNSCSKLEQLEMASTFARLAGKRMASLLWVISQVDAFKAGSDTEYRIRVSKLETKLNELLSFRHEALVSLSSNAGEVKSSAPRYIRIR